MTDQQLKEFRELTQPLCDWLYINGSPHHTIIIDEVHAELVAGEMAIEFHLRD